MEILYRPQGKGSALAERRQWKHKAKAVPWPNEGSGSTRQRLDLRGGPASVGPAGELQSGRAGRGQRGGTAGGLRAAARAAGAAGGAGAGATTTTNNQHSNSTTSSSSKQTLNCAVLRRRVHLQRHLGRAERNRPGLVKSPRQQRLRAPAL